MKSIEITAAVPQDFEEIWRIFKIIIAGGDTYVNNSDTSRKEAYEKWMNPNARTFLAYLNGRVAGAYLLRSNQVGRGSHIANASYIVDPQMRGQGIGKSLAEHSITTAHQLGYYGMQFNFVVSTNLPAVNLWKSVGFKVIGTIPQAFNHAKLGLVDAYIMYRKL